MGSPRAEPLAGRPQLLHAVHLNFFEDVRGRSPAVLLKAWSTLADVAEAATAGSVRVSVVQASTIEEQYEHAGVQYYFLPFGRDPRHGGYAALDRLLRRLSPQVLHVHGLDWTLEFQWLASAAHGIPVVAQDHASRCPRVWRRREWRRGFANLAGIAFCARRQAQPFIDAGLLAAHTRIYQVPESTTRFAPADQAQARRETRIGGDPALLWVGHLDRNKDPLTVLDGVSIAAQALPGLRLWCCYAQAPLLGAVRRRIHRDARLRERVNLLGAVPHAVVERMMQAADLFVLGSHREGSGYALIEALACGLSPVVTDIPSFRALTGEGAVGRLWPCGAAPACAAALHSAALSLGTQTRAAVRAHFERELSPKSLGSRLAAVYQDLVNRANQTVELGPVPVEPASMAP